MANSQQQLDVFYPISQTMLNAPLRPVSTMVEDIRFW